MSPHARLGGAWRGALDAALGAPLLTLLAIAATSQAGAATSQATPDPTRGDLRVVVFGDFHGPYGSVDYPNAVARVVTAIVDDWRPDLVLLPGDLVAGQSRGLPEARFAEMWSAFDAAVAAPLRRAGVPYAASLGNHDASKLRGADGAFLFARERDAAAAYWRDPSHRAGLDVDLEPRQVRIRGYDPATLTPLPTAALPAAVEGFGGRVDRSARVAP